MTNQSRSRTLEINQSNLVRERSAARKLQMKSNGHGRKCHPRKGSLNPRGFHNLIRSTIGVKIIRHG
jgi:hypothetical protein